MTNEPRSGEVIVISTDIGLLPFSPEAAEIDAEGVPRNLMHGTEYVLLDSERADAFVNGEYTVRSEDEVRHVGAYTLIFANPRIEVPSVTNGLEGADGQD